MENILYSSGISCWFLNFRLLDRLNESFRSVLTVKTKSVHFFFFWGSGHRPLVKPLTQIEASQVGQMLGGHCALCEMCKGSGFLTFY